MVMQDTSIAEPIAEPLESIEEQETTSEGPNWDTPENPHFQKAQSLQEKLDAEQKAKAELEGRLNSISPAYQQWLQEQEKAAQERLHQTLYNAGLSDQEVQDVATYVQAGFRFLGAQEKLGAMARDNMAFEEAMRVLGPDATIREMQEFVGQLKAYQDPTLLRQAADLFGGHWRQGRREQRISSGAERVEGVQRLSGVAASSFEQIERKIAEQGLYSLTSTEKKRYAQERRSRDLPVPADW